MARMRMTECGLFYNHRGYQLHVSLNQLEPAQLHARAKETCRRHLNRSVPRLRLFEPECGWKCRTAGVL